MAHPLERALQLFVKNSRQPLLETGSDLTASSTEHRCRNPGAAKPTAGHEEATGVRAAGRWHVCNTERGVPPALALTAQASGCLKFKSSLVAKKENIPLYYGSHPNRSLFLFS